MSKKKKPRVLILYGSQKGNAKSIAETIGESLGKFGFDGEVRAGNDFAKKLDEFAKERVVVMVVSTTGAGEHPDNCGRFFRKLNKKTVAKDLLDSQKFTVLAVGDTNYDNFCRAGKRFDALFEKLGGERIYALGCADDAVGLEAVIDPWLRGLWPALRVAAGVTTAVSSPIIEGRSGSFSEVECDDDDVKEEELEGKKKDETCRLLQFHEMFPDVNLEEELSKMKKKPRLRKCAVKLKYTSSSTTTTTTFTLDQPEQQQQQQQKTFEGEIISARYLTKTCNTEDKRVIHIEVEKQKDKDEDEAWETGDAFGIFCENRADVVNSVIRRLKLCEKIDKPCRVIRGPSHLKNLKNMTNLRDMLTSRVDLSLDVPPRKAFLRQLAEFCEDSKDRDALICICSNEIFFHKMIESQHPNLPELLNMFPSCCPPPEIILNAMPPLVPRYYSASSSPLVNENRISFAFSVLEYYIGEDVRRRKRQGVCTSWLEAKCLELLLLSSSSSSSSLDKKRVSIRMMRRLQSNNFRPPADTTKPLILIGPGTGVAPFLGFLQHRHARIEMSKKVEEDTCTGCWRGGFEVEEDCKSTSDFGPIHLFFGCRHEKKDFLYQEELKQYLDSGVLTRLYTAFSRDQKEKIYVTHKMKEFGKNISKMILNEDACVYVCGDGAKMAKDVQSAISDVLLNHSEMDLDAVESYVDSMIRRGRYLADVW
jgi:methionine synthase reductase